MGLDVGIIYLLEVFHTKPLTKQNTCWSIIGAPIPGLVKYYTMSRNILPYAIQDQTHTYRDISLCGYPMFKQPASILVQNANCRAGSLHYQPSHHPNVPKPSYPITEILSYNSRT